MIQGRMYQVLHLVTLDIFPLAWKQFFQTTCSSFSWLRFFKLPLIRFVLIVYHICPLTAKRLKKPLYFSCHCTSIATSGPVSPLFSFFNGLNVLFCCSVNVSTRDVKIHLLFLILAYAQKICK